MKQSSPKAYYYITLDVSLMLFKGVMVFYPFLKEKHGPFYRTGLGQRRQISIERAVAKFPKPLPRCTAIHCRP